MSYNMLNIFKLLGNDNNNININNKKHTAEASSVSSLSSSQLKYGSCL